VPNMARFVAKSLLVAVLCVTHPLCAMAQGPGGLSIDVFAFGGYAFSDLNEVVYGAGAAASISSRLSVAVIGTKADVSYGSLGLYEVRLNWIARTRGIRPYLTAGLALERSSAPGFQARTDQGYVFGGGLEVRSARVAVFGELIGLKNGAVSGQGRGGVRLRVL
jgi:hypothetical protein